MNDISISDTSFRTAYHFPTESHTGARGIHTFSIVKSPTDGGYLGYAGPVSSGPIDLWYSADLESWERLANSPILDLPGLRWPTALQNDGELYIATRGGKSGLGASLRYRLEQKLSRLPFLQSPPPMHIDLYHSSDGQSLTKMGRLVGPESTGQPYNRNPFLFSPHDGGVGLVYYAGDGTAYEIRCRTAETVPALSESTDVVLRRSDELIAAPAIWYHPGQNRYVLFVEAFDEDGGVWITKVFEHPRIEEQFGPEDGKVLFEGNEACAFPYVNGDTLYVFVSHCLGDVTYGGIDAQWEGYLYVADL